MELRFDMIQVKWLINNCNGIHKPALVKSLGCEDVTMGDKYH